MEKGELVVVDGGDGAEKAEAEVVPENGNEEEIGQEIDLKIETAGSQTNLDGEPVSDSESKAMELQADLKERLQKEENRCKELETLLSSRDESIASLQRSCVILEKENGLLKRELEISVKEKECAVIRYATVEKKVLDANSAKDQTEKKWKDSQRDVEALNNKIKGLNLEKNRICQIVDQKCAEIRSYQKEIEKLRNDVGALETKVKWNGVKIKQEMEAKGMAEAKVEELQVELNGFRNSEEIRVKAEVDSERLQVLEKQAVEQQASLILLKHENEKKESKIDYLSHSNNDLKSELTSFKESNESLARENRLLAEDNEKCKEEINDLQVTLDRENFKLAEMQAKLNDFETNRAQLRIERDANSELTVELKTVKESLEETNGDLERMQSREAELLQFNKELTECNVKLQNEISLFNAKSIALCLENETLKKEKRTFDEKLSSLSEELAKEVEERSQERILLTKHISEKIKLNEQLQKKLDNALGDLEAIKNKNSQTIKELTREASQLRKKCANLEKYKPENISESNSLRSETSDSESIPNGHSTPREESPTTTNPPEVLVKEPGKQHLIDKIVRLQQANAKQMEKIDFLENHSSTLVSEIQKKSKLVHYYMLRDQVGALASSKSDKNKLELAKYGGVMSAIYGGVRGASNSEMTLELSLEINRKLQAVLEDTLLKNITLKENLDTLGLEVDKLTRKLARQ